MSDVWEVFALKYADHNIRSRSESFLFDDNHDAPWPLDYFIWLLKNNDKYILVDTGFDEKECKLRGRTLHEEPAAILTRFGVQPDMIDDVILTHMHYDHAGSINDFMHATFHLQEFEMQYATGPCMCHGALRKPFTVEHVCNIVKQLYDGKLKFHNGASQIAPGIEVHLIGGHSRGLQCVRVKTRRGWVVLASDASHYYENFLHGKPFPIVVDLEDMLNGFQTIQTLADSTQHIIPGHDPSVRSLYPAVHSGDDSIVRLDISPITP